ncbi:MAG: hypothetical protein WKF79_05545 [Nocardioides sp.]
MSSLGNQGPSSLKPSQRPQPPDAARASAPGWRDPRLWIGVAIVAASVVAGGRLLASADDTVSVWAVTTDLGVGDQVSEDDLVARRVRFADGADLDRYFTVDARLPDDGALTRSVGEGELLPRAAVGPASDVGSLEVPIAVDDELVPTSVTSGSVVDVYLVAAARGAGETPDAVVRPVLEAVTVVDAPPIEESFGTSGQRKLVVAVPEEEAPRFFAELGAVDDPVLTVVRRS